MSTPSNKDIPAARRHSSKPVVSNPIATENRRGSGVWVLRKAFGVLGFSAIATLIIWQWKPISQQTVKQTQRIQTALAQRSDDNPLPTSAVQESSDPENSDLENLNPENSQSPRAETSLPVQSANPLATKGPNQLLNHRRYEEANPADLVLLNPNSQLRLQAPVQIAVNEMIAKAKAEGVQLGIASAFRSVEDQNRLFFEVKAERRQNSTTRAEVSAPPGYSEHHTGYAVDFIDESKPGTHTEESFENTPAFQWLKQNAPAYNFEMSFPKDPDSPVSYEPWHWRYVGDRKSLELFYQEQTPLSKTTSESASEFASEPALEPTSEPVTSP